ncbi:MAG: integrating conjugative element protein [Pseudoxanthomonas sp.]|nr:integrating conjugative element protein [Pseudoxanthomonas sp.]HRL52877.1 integrating conjugative element protein [Acidovorax temperans]
MRKALLYPIATALLLGALAQAQAQTGAPPALRQIDAGGPTVPVDPYFSYLIAGDDQPAVLQGLAFPMLSQLKPGVLIGRSRQVIDPQWLTQPIFVIGADEVSLAWLRRHQDALRRLGASGVVVAAHSAQAFKQAQRAADGLPLAPALGTWLQERLIAAGVTVVPLLIALDGHAVPAPEAMVVNPPARKGRS